jgi:hypothetical protein
MNLFYITILIPDLLNKILCLVKKNINFEKTNINR